MRIAVFGATGATGREIVAQALGLGMDVTAYVRDPSRLGGAEGDVRVVTGTLDDDARIAEAVAGCDAVLCALGVGRPLRSDPEVVEGVARIVAAMDAAGVRRLVYLSFIGVGASREHAGPVIRRAAWRVLRNEVSDHERKEAIVAASGLDWTIVRAPKLRGGAATGAFRSGEGVGARGVLPRLPRADVAAFMLREVTEPGFVRAAPSLVP